MTRFRGVIEFVLFMASILKMRFTFCLIAQNIHQLIKYIIESLNNKHIPISTLHGYLLNNYPAKSRGISSDT